jgi:predicted dehydrogenase
MGIVGPGFVAEHHVDAVRRLGYVDVVALAGSSKASADRKAEAWHIPRAYAHFEELVKDPAVEVVHVTTPNHLHHPVIMAAISAGKHVISDKPLALTSQECRGLWQAGLASRRANVLTFNYRGNPLVQQARAMILAGEIGAPVFIHGHYLQEWLTDEHVYSWRSNPALGGESSALADIGSHWCDLIEHVAGRRIESVLADITTVVPVRYSTPNSRSEAFSSGGVKPTVPNEVHAEDLASVLLRFAGGARGCFSVGQVLPGHKNDLYFEICGRKGSIRWQQERPAELQFTPFGEATRTIVQQIDARYPDAQRLTHLPPGHNQGWPDAFRNVMADAYAWIRSGADPRDKPAPIATFEDGYRSSRLLDAMLQSAGQNGAWTIVAEAEL